MQTKAVRLYGKNNLKLETFELPDIQEDEIKAKIITDSVCMSTYKLTQMGQDHKRASKNLEKNPVIIGHEFCGIIETVGNKWKHKFQPGDKFIIQPAQFYETNLYAPGFSFPYLGGNATYINIPNIVMEKEYLIPFSSEAFYFGSLAEPMACISAAFHASYHVNQSTYEHKMGIKKGGNLALLASAGPMGLGAIDYAIHCENAPSLLVVTDIDDNRLKRAQVLFPPEKAAKLKIDIKYINTKNLTDPVTELKELSHGGFDDVFVMAPVEQLIAQAGQILGPDGCLNFFAGPTNTELFAPINFYDIHYSSKHIMGTTGSRIADMRMVVDLMNQGVLDPTAMITHIGGINSVANTVLNLNKISGGKKLIYNQIDLPLIAINDFAEKGRTDPIFAELANIVKHNNGLWCLEAEQYLLNFKY